MFSTIPVSHSSHLSFPFGFPCFYWIVFTSLLMLLRQLEAGGKEKNHKAHTTVNHAGLQFHEDHNYIPVCHCNAYMLLMNIVKWID